MVLLHGTELNIAADGSVDWDEDFLSGFDICVASVPKELSAGWGPVLNGRDHRRPNETRASGYPLRA
jgi:histidinol phosphatase-like PHP family hydrolase